MKIGILGTRGIPNKYGGFEEFAEQISKVFRAFDHEVFVYCEGELDFVRTQDNGIILVFVKSNSSSFINQFIYDYKCTKDACLRDLDIIYHAGYVTSVIGNLFFYQKLKDKLIYNMDGLEWKRSKFSYLTRYTIRILERIAVRSCENLVADNIGIQKYIKNKYKKDSTLIEYGVMSVINKPNISDVTDKELRRLLELIPKKFDLLIARFEPENSIREIFMAYQKLGIPLVVVSNINTDFYSEIYKEICNYEGLILLGPIYNKFFLNYLRSECRYYVHGHTVGGTNPSLLEAMICGCKIFAHDNEFNRDVLSDFGTYWKNSNELINLLDRVELVKFKEEFNQIKYVTDRFDWNLIGLKHLQLFEKIRNV
jgi:glycosyltransferase involved in cell wall biosynthesis